jgi:ribosomal protein S18 acetylase RimI-like enzyme
MKTWPDFEKFFLRPAEMVGDGWWCWCTHHHVSSYSLPENKQPRTRAERAEKNRVKKRALVQKGCAHGILVYANAEPVGWCQYGPKNELPRVDHSRNYRAAARTDRGERLWRITSFVVDKNHRRRGVARIALRAALDSIRRKGGGLVEAYPVAQTDQGPNYLYSGTLKMFEGIGFRTVGSLSSGERLRS